jgi:hypothetical protein
LPAWVPPPDPTLLDDKVLDANVEQNQVAFTVVDRPGT